MRRLDRFCGSSVQDTEQRMLLGAVFGMISDQEVADKKFEVLRSVRGCLCYRLEAGALAARGLKRGSMLFFGFQWLRSG